MMKKITEKLGSRKKCYYQSNLELSKQFIKLMINVDGKHK